MFLKDPHLNEELPCLGGRVVLLSHGRRRLTVVGDELLD